MIQNYLRQKVYGCGLKTFYVSLFCIIAEYYGLINLKRTILQRDNIDLKTDVGN